MGSNSETHQIDNFETMYLTFVEANNYWPNRIIVTDHQESPPKPDTNGMAEEICSTKAHYPSQRLMM